MHTQVEMRKILSVNVIFLVLGFFRVAGNFPYRWQKAANGVLEVTVSSIAALWSGLVLLFVAGTCLFSITNLKSSAHRGTEKVLDSILRTYWYVMLTFLYAYFAFNSRSLARILRKMVTAGVNLRRRIVDVSDVPIAICAVCIAFGVFWSLLKVVHDDTQRVFSRVVDSIADLSITLFLSILYFLVKVVSLEMEETVGSLRRKESRPAEVPWASPPPAEPKTMTTTATNFEAAASPLAKPLRSPAQRLFQLDEVMRQIVGFTGPPVALLLLNNISASTVFLYNAITDRDIYYALYIVVPVSRMVHVILVPDPLLRKVRLCNCCNSQIMIERSKCCI